MRKFGFTMAIVLLGVSSVMFMRHKSGYSIPFAAAVLFGVAGIFKPVLLKPVYDAWMRFAAILAWVNTRVILSVLFYAVLTPFGICMRIFGKDPLSRDIDRKRSSYWITKESRAVMPEEFERQY